MDPRERARERMPLLKPRGGYGARHVDAEAERVGLVHLERLAGDVGCAIELIVDPVAGVTHRLGSGPRTIWASMDAIDGTVKGAGARGGARGRGGPPPRGGRGPGLALPG